MRPIRSGLRAKSNMKVEVVNKEILKEICISLLRQVLPTELNSLIQLRGNCWLIERQYKRSKLLCKDVRKIGKSSICKLLDEDNKYKAFYHLGNLVNH